MTTILLVNGNFTQGLPTLAEGEQGWRTVNGYWHVAPKQGIYWAQCDQDWDKKNNQPRGWLYGQEDWLRQTAQATEPHTAVSLTLTEIHHIQQDTVIERRLFGSYDGLEWALLWELAGVDHIPPVTTENRESVTNTYTAESDHAYYMVELYGHYLSVATQPGRAAPDGYKVTDVILLEVS